MAQTQWALFNQKLLFGPTLSTHLSSSPSNPKTIYPPLAKQAMELQWLFTSPPLKQPKFYVNSRLLHKPISSLHRKNLSGRRKFVTFCCNQGAHTKQSTEKSLSFEGKQTDGVEPVRGKPGSISFHGLTYEAVGEGKLVSSPFVEGSGSVAWLFGPTAFVASFVLPQFVLGGVIETFIKNEVVAELVNSLSTEAMFYVGFATFLAVTNHVQKPYLQFSSKRWGLITGLRGYLTSAFLVMGFKVFAPIFVVVITWPVLGLPALIAVTPFLLGCLVQFVFERRLDKGESSCWPLVPIVFEVYRIYQLTRAAHFIQSLMFTMKDAPVTPELMERASSMVALAFTFNVLGIVCLWSLMTFLLRLFPSRPVAENY